MIFVTTYTSLILEKSMPHLQDWIAIKFLVQKYGAGIVLPGVDFDGKGGLEVRQELMFKSGYYASDFILSSWGSNNDKRAYRDRIDSRLE